MDTKQIILRLKVQTCPYRLGEGPGPNMRLAVSGEKRGGGKIRNKASSIESRLMTISQWAHG